MAGLAGAGDSGQRAHPAGAPGNACRAGGCHRDRMEAGYRVLCWQIVDADIAAVSPGTVYNVLKRGGFTKKWAGIREETKKSFRQPRTIHEQWYSDFSYIRVCGNHYYFISVMDGYSWKILAWGLYEKTGCGPRRY